ncbi:MAG: 2-C-methyl-D-erythritol 4-phosphate cytidylyltransferase [Defluviitaleaceae bacterium]|nr:2-C-methyl-D-erythritol 4-phosphate cytidylyltransferase [Defluviitaleaceae bacterium]MCL2264028.1 2-C-methyl-D-erythritol 4-phosphate cytidylyltransferase [Defluviitaleaceae bacterium]
MKISVVIPAGGAGLRFGGEVPKQFLQLGGEPILKRTLAVFDSHPNVNEIAVAAHESYFCELESYKIGKLKHIVQGGETRAQSVFSALQAISPATDVVLIHDGIRPFVTHEIITAVAQAALEHGAAVACSPVTDTIKQVTGGIITATPDRSTLWQAQTPQGFTYSTIMQAYAAAHADDTLSTATDDSALAERIGISVHVVPSSPSNIKITTPTDLIIARALLEYKE